MNRFMIGQFGSFNHNKQKRDFRSSFYGVEACLLKDKDIAELIGNAENDNFSIGVHFPLRQGGWKFRDPQFLSKDKIVRTESFEYMDKEINYLKEIRPQYILVHYPKPVILDDTVDWSMWRFADGSEYYYESEYTYREFEEKSYALFNWLDSKGKEIGSTIILELDAINKYIYEGNLLENLLQQYPSIKLCLDIGRLHLQNKLDNRFNSYDLVERYAKYADLIHLWNVRIDTNLENSHYPPLPTLLPEDGWADVREYLNIINNQNKTCKILFEHNSAVITDKELDDCYNWIESIISK